MRTLRLFLAGANLGVGLVAIAAGASTAWFHFALAAGLYATHLLMDGAR